MISRNAETINECITLYYSYVNSKLRESPYVNEVDQGIEDFKSIRKMQDIRTSHSLIRMAKS